MLGHAFFVNRSLTIIYNISENKNTWIDLVSLIAYVVLTIIIISLTLWLAHRSPQAIRAKAEMNVISKEFREEHYSQINKQILSNLKTGTIIWGGKIYGTFNLKLSYNDLRDNAYFGFANNHINYECKGIEIKYNEFLAELSKYNKNCEKFVTNVRKIIHSNKYDEEFKIFDSVEYLEMNSKQLFLSGLLEIVINICKTKSTIQDKIELESSIRTLLRENCKCEGIPPMQPYEMSTTKIYFIGFLLCSHYGKGKNPFNKDSIKKLINLITEITLKNDVIGEYKKLMAHEKHLGQLDEQYKICFDRMSKNIEAKIYDTRLSNCCDDKTLLK